MRMIALSRFDKLVILACLMLVYTMGVLDLKSGPIAREEVNSIKHLYHSHAEPHYSISQTIESITIRSSDHTPGYFVILNLWSRLVGRDLFVLRLLSIYFALLAIVMTYRLALLTGKKEIARDAVLVVSFLAFFFYYAHEVRMYAFLSLLSAWVAWSYWRVVSSAHRVSTWKWLSLLISATIIMYVHILASFVLAAIVLYHLIFTPKNKRWLKTFLIFVTAGLLFLPWLPVSLDVILSRVGPDTDLPSADRLFLLEALLAFVRLYSNGLILLAPAAILAVLLNYKQLNTFSRYILIVICLTISLLLLGNEFSTLIIARRMRYTLVFSIFLSCSLAIAFNLIPHWRLLRLPAVAAWVLSFFVFMDSTDFNLYTSRLAHNQEQVPHFQHFVYNPNITPQQSDVVLSFHTDTPLKEKKIMNYYANVLAKWHGMIHIYNNEQGNPILQSTDTRYTTVDSMPAWNFPIWLIYNPQQTDLLTMPVYTEDFSKHFQRCKRLLEEDNTVIDLYLKVTLPCELVLRENPLQIHYEHGSQLQNIAIEHTDDVLKVHFWWTDKIFNQYAFSLQIFDQQGNKQQQLDDVIGGGPTYSYLMDISTFTAGDYVVKLILYDFLTQESQSGNILAQQQRFDREVELLHFSVEA